MSEHLGKLIGELPYLKNAVIDIAYTREAVSRKRPVEDIWVKLVAELIEEGWAKKDLREVDTFLGTLDDGPDSDEFTDFVIGISGVPDEKEGSMELMKNVSILLDSIADTL